MAPSNDFTYDLASEHVDPRRLRRERNKAQQLRRSQWWQRRIGQGVCHYCEAEVGRDALTMDHVVPLARGGVTSKNNVVPSCEPCNRDKKLATPVETLLAQPS